MDVPRWKLNAWKYLKRIKAQKVTIPLSLQSKEWSNLAGHPYWNTNPLLHSTLAFVYMHNTVCKSIRAQASRSNNKTSHALWHSSQAAEIYISLHSVEDKQEDGQLNMNEVSVPTSQWLPWKCTPLATYQISPLPCRLRLEPLMDWGNGRTSLGHCDYMPSS